MGRRVLRTVCDRHRDCRSFSYRRRGKKKLLSCGPKVDLGSRRTSTDTGILVQDQLRCVRSKSCSEISLSLREGTGTEETTIGPTLELPSSTWTREPDTLPLTCNLCSLVFPSSDSGYDSPKCRRDRWTTCGCVLPSAQDRIIP